MSYEELDSLIGEGRQWLSEQRAKLRKRQLLGGGGGGAAEQ